MRRARQRGQAIIEYAVIGVGIILVFLLASSLLQPLLRANMEDTRQGLDSESFLRP